MKFVHSFWSKAYLHGRWGLQDKFFDDLFCFALSAALLRKHGKDVELITDDYGAELFRGLPYKRVSLDLNDIAHVDPQYWTAGKVYSLSIQKKPCIHLDGDVFFLEKTALEAAKMEWDILVQSKEIGEHFLTTYPPTLETLTPYLKNLSSLSRFNFTYNTGVFGVSDYVFFKKYSFEYFNLIYELEIQEARIPEGRDWNICLEQSLLTTMSQDANLYVKEVITGNEMEFPGFFESADEKGYAHFWGSTKYDKWWQRKIRARLKVEAPEVWQKLVEREESFFLSGKLI